MNSIHNIHPRTGVTNALTSASPSHYTLTCEICGATFEDDGVQLECPAAHERALLRTRYQREKLEPDELAIGLYRYRHWLPIRRTLLGSARTTTFQSIRLSQAVALPNLWVAFNGFWPERGAFMPTATFKDLEAYAVLARLPNRSADVLVVASAGNTAMAFAHASSLNLVRCLIIVPETALKRMRLPLSCYTKIVALGEGADYSDAIALAELIGAKPGLVKEGGVRNVARRDGLGTVLLNAVESIGKMPDYYFQSIGSGAGAIAVHEAGKRLLKDGRFGYRLPRLMLSQNLPFAPIYKAWSSGDRRWMPIDPEEAKSAIDQIDATVLSNRNPPYSISGGIFDVLTQSAGTMLAADNAQSRSAARMFKELEGVEIEPASAVAFATLLQTVRYGQIERDAVVLLNITGGKNRDEISQQCKPQPDLILRCDDIRKVSTLDRVMELFN